MTTPRTRSGWSAAVMRATQLPNAWPTMIACPSRAFSMVKATSLARSCSVIPSVGPVLLPAPGLAAFGGARFRWTTTRWPKDWRGPAFAFCDLNRACAEGRGRRVATSFFCSYIVAIQRRLERVENTYIRISWRTGCPGVRSCNAKHICGRSRPKYHLACTGVADSHGASV